MRVATIQFAPRYKEAQSNLQRLARLVVQAARGGAQLIVMPELALSGYSMMSVAEAKPMAEVLSGTPSAKSSLRVMQTLAQKLKVHLVWGLIEQDAGTGLLYNAQVYVNPAGDFMSYRKVNLWGNDILWAKEGKGNPAIYPSAVFQSEVGQVIKKVGLLICRDVRDKKNDKWSSFYERGDADIVCMSSCWGRGGFPATAWWDFAKDNKVTLIVSNRYGIEIANDFGEGGVCIISPDGTVQCDGLEWGKDCIVYGEV